MAECGPGQDIYDRFLWNLDSLPAFVWDLNPLPAFAGPAFADILGFDLMFRGADVFLAPLVLKPCHALAPSALLCSFGAALPA